MVCARMALACVIRHGRAKAAVCEPAPAAAAVRMACVRRMVAAVAILALVGWTAHSGAARKIAIIAAAV